MKEQDFQAQIQKKLEAEGWCVLKLIKTNKNGVSDLIAIHPDRPAYFLECKRKNGRASELQKYRLEDYRNKGFNVAISYGHEIVPFDEEFKEEDKLNF